MLQRTPSAQSLILYKSPKLAALSLPHAFTTRHGGTSTGPYASLNLGSLEKSRDTDFNLAVAENFRRLRRALGQKRLARVECRQVHSHQVWDVTGPPRRPADAPEADAMITTQTGRMLTIRTADCVPVLFASADGKVVAAAHAGWRGIVAGILPNTIRAFEQHYKIPPDQLIAAIGPAISVEHFEVGPEVAQAFRDADLEEAVHQSPYRRKAHIDLHAAALAQLGYAGIPLMQIDTNDCCTFRDEDDFFSHRRDHGKTGRMAAVIALPST